VRRVQQSFTNQFYITCQSRKHHGTNYPEYEEKYISIFKRKLEVLTNCPNIMVKSSKTDNKNDSYMASYRIALAGETLTTTCAVIMATCMSGIQSKRKLETLELSNNTVKRRIHDLSTAVENNWCRDLSPACFFTAT
jgi:hypothetical protein